MHAHWYSEDSKESLLVNYVKSTLQHMLETSGLDSDGNDCNEQDAQLLVEQAAPIGP